MFTRSVFRSAAPLKRNIRSYATESGSGGGSLGTILGYAGGTAVVAGGAAWAYQNFGGSREDGSRDHSGPSPKAFQGGEQGFISLKLESADDVSHNTRKLRFQLPESNMISGLPVASAVVAKYKGENDEKATIRPYTPTSEVDEKGFVDFVIKRYPNGPMSEHIHALKPGETLDIKGPIPKYGVEVNQHKHIAMIAGGTGITPMYQVLRKLLQDPEDKTKLSLVFGNVKEEDILLKKELQEFENTYPQRFRVFYTLDQPPEGWEQGKGFITKDLLQTVLPEPKEENIKIFVCGPPGLYKAVSGAKKSPTDQGELTGILADLGYSKDQIFKF